MKKTPEEVVVATFLKESIFCSVGASVFVEGGVSNNVGIFCSAKTGALAGEDDVNVKLGDVWFNRDVTGADVTDPMSPKLVFAALVFGTAGDTLFGIISETSLDEYELLSPAAKVVVSVRVGSACVLVATLVSAAQGISLTSSAADTGEKIFRKEGVTVAVVTITSLGDDDDFLTKSSVERPRMTQVMSRKHTKRHTHISFPTYHF